MPARSAALASWIARTSFWVIDSCVVAARRTARSGTCGRRRRRGCCAPALAPTIAPSRSITPARYISATTSMMPDPHTPVTPVAATPAANPGSSDHTSHPITLSRGSSVTGSMRTRSIAPAVARCPQLIWAPSNAGPVGLDAAYWRRCGRRARSRRWCRRRRAAALARLGAVPRPASPRRCRRRRARRCTVRRRTTRTAGRGRARRPARRPHGRSPARTAPARAASGRCRARGGA